MSNQEELFFLKGLRILVNASALELRRVFKEVWDQENPQQLWQDDVQSGTLFYDNYKPNGNIKMYDDKIKSGKRDDWDMTVLGRVFIEYKFFVDGKYSENVKKLKELRNTYSHVTSMARSESEFEADERTVRSVFRELGLNNDVLEEALNVDKEVDQQWRDEMKQLFLKLLQEVQELGGRLDVIESRLGAGGGPSVDGPTETAHSSSGKVELPDWFSSLSSSCRQKRIRERDLVKIVKHIGGGWELVAAELGIKKAERENATDPRKGMVMQMMDVFVKWVQRQSKNATREAFIKALFACNDSCTINWDGIEEEFKLLSDDSVSR